MPEFVFQLGDIPNTRQKADLVLTAFGLGKLRSVFFRPGGDIKDSATSFAGANIDPLNYTDSSAGVSPLGTPYFDSLVLGPLKYKDKNGREFTLEKFEDIVCLIDVTLQNRVVTSSPVAGTGTVKEYMGEDDFAITLRGLLLPEGNNIAYPLDQFNKLSKLLRASTPIPVTCKALARWNITHIVCLDAPFAMEAGFPYSQAYQVSCLSDNPVDILQVY